MTVNAEAGATNTLPSKRHQLSSPHVLPRVLSPLMRSTPSHESARACAVRSMGAPHEPGGDETQTPSAPRQERPRAHEPQEPPQPLSPQLRPRQLGTHVLQEVWFAEHTRLVPRHVPHDPPQPSSPQIFPWQSGVQEHALHLEPVFMVWEQKPDRTCRGCTPARRRTAHEGRARTRISLCCF